ncbi:MAG: outer membrane beta-barrel protein [Bacteroidales bacterium]|jgi:hypothetical protein|nr:outer membrane beta-barrel protein [Bacteroidales bacterium]
MKKYFFFLFIVSLIYYPISAQTSAQDTTFKKIRLGGYGEMLYQWMDYGPDRYKGDGAPKDKRAYISIPRAIFAIDYKFRHDIVLGTEIEFEYGGTGAAMEFEYAEAGEYEMEVEKAGEVVLEQFHITKSFGSIFNIRVGHMIVPVGLTNAHHEPIFFFGSSRPEGEMTMIPCTWHETGISVLGSFSKIGLNYELMVVNGLDPNGFSKAEWVRVGRQKIFELSTMTSPAFVGRLEYSPVKNLRIGASGYYNKSAKNASKPEKMTSVKGKVSIVTADAQYASSNIVARANFIYGNLTDSKRISELNRTVSSKAGFPRTDVAKNAMTYAAEAGYNVLSFFNTKQKLFPFIRYEYYNTMEDVESGVTKDTRYKRDILSFGLNYYILPNLVVKADYAMRQIDNGTYNDENTFGISVAYTGWFIKK